MNEISPDEQEQEIARCGCVDEIICSRCGFCQFDCFCEEDEDAEGGEE